MPTETRIVRPGPRDMTVRTDAGEVLGLPPGWGYLPPGDAGVTRRVKALGPSWTIEVERGRKRFSQGLWAPAANIAKAQDAVTSTRATPEYARKLASDRARRERAQDAYVLDFTRHVEAFLAFHATHAAIARELAQRIAEHATPVGSGTVARTERIPVAERAEAAVIAWLRHQTTGYDRMQIPREQGKRREVRRMLAQRSRELLSRYRRGEPVDPECPLAKALAKPRPSAAEAPADNARLTVGPSGPAPRPALAASAPRVRPSAARPAGATTGPPARAAALGAPVATGAAAATAGTATATAAGTATATVAAAASSQRNDGAPLDDRAAKQQAVRDRMLRRSK